MYIFLAEIFVHKKDRYGYEFLCHIVFFRGSLQHEKYVSILELAEVRSNFTCVQIFFEPFECRCCEIFDWFAFLGISTFDGIFLIIRNFPVLIYPFYHHSARPMENIAITIKTRSSHEDETFILIESPGSKLTSTMCVLSTVFPSSVFKMCIVQHIYYITFLLIFQLFDD